MSSTINGVLPYQGMKQISARPSGMGAASGQKAWEASVQARVQKAIVRQRLDFNQKRASDQVARKPINQLKKFMF